MSDQFENITLIKKANVYFGGNVSSRTVKFADGTHKTLGYMQPGEYTFGTDAPEIMEVLGGAITVKLPGASTWETVPAGSSFNVPGDSAFDVKIEGEGADYCCAYLPKA